MHMRSMHAAIRPAGVCNTRTAALRSICMHPVVSPAASRRLELASNERGGVEGRVEEFNTCIVLYHSQPNSKRQSFVRCTVNGMRPHTQRDKIKKCMPGFARLLRRLVPYEPSMYSHTADFF
ncbi:hypothetical protein EVAR_69177_1 [Eumeta japonica]|uniref:Uncharacterized protein n=1 Tax=Eumeta variegata TaxID=151549 RepID=A0A4C1ZHW8_EUMVA|nr:hypothetical protein EVAR_69177_1 [Eumeta japonica]